MKNLNSSVCDVNSVCARAFIEITECALEEIFCKLDFPYCIHLPPPPTPQPFYVSHLYLYIHSLSCREL